MSNQLIIDCFKKLVKLIGIETNDLTDKKEIKINQFRMMNLNKVIKIISKIKQPITSSSQLNNIKGIGKNTLARVDEIIKTGTLSELKNYDEKIKNSLQRETAISDLMRIIGIGRVLALNLVDTHHIMSVTDLKQQLALGNIELNEKIKLGLEYSGKFEGSIPRNEVDLIYDHLQQLTNNYRNSMFITICGSYRRGAKISSDVDVLLSDMNIITMDDIRQDDLMNYVTYLHTQQFLIDDITDKHIKTKYMGFARLNEKTPIRRIDIRLIPMISYFPALLYFTGSNNFNQEMRAKAKRLGWKLNEYGLYDIETNEMTTVMSEQDIFSILQMNYVDPEER